MATTDLRKTVLQTINEVQRKLGLTEATSLTVNAQTTTLLDHLNDIIADVSDFGDWHEQLVSGNVTVSASVRDYSVTSGSVVVKNIKDIYYGSASRSSMQLRTIDEMRRNQRSGAVTGSPREFSVYGVDTNGNPKVRINPLPGTTEAGNVLSILYYKKPPIYTTSDGSTEIPFPSRIIVQGLLAMAILDEEGGSPSNHFNLEYEKYLTMRKEAYNRFNADTGRYKRFNPARIGRR